jgi:hypothetical protein
MESNEAQRQALELEEVVRVVITDRPSLVSGGISGCGRCSHPVGRQALT